MDGTRKYHAGPSNSDPKPYASYVLTNKQILGKMYKIPRMKNSRGMASQRAQSHLGGRRKQSEEWGRPWVGMKYGGEEG